MENASLYRLHWPRQLPVLEEPVQQIVWSENKFEENVFLLYLQDFGLREENLKKWELSTRAAVELATTAIAVTWPSVKAGKKAQRELEKTGKIKGSLYLAPNLQKVWISRYDFKYLKKVS